MSTNPGAGAREREVGGVRYERIPVQTHLIHIKEPLDPVFDEYVKPLLRPGDWLAVSEKFVTISQGRVIHQSVVRPGLLARLLVKGVTKHPDDVGYSDPRKMQVAIMQAGWWRMLFAMILGGLSRLLLRRRGDFYRIAGHRISEIDGFNPATVKPFDEFAMLGPDDPDVAAGRIAGHIGAPVAIVDANNINIEVLGTSPAFPVPPALVRDVLLDNPLGQGDERTPIIVVRTGT
ncbi:MAG TPA: F420-0--gamma-glutamyl ligase [Acidimicrobiia bacterium]|nr:F420-0--gamma-glutamyl ligase [Acidimicrobiia bacterium]